MISFTSASNKEIYPLMDKIVAYTAQDARSNDWKLDDSETHFGFLDGWTLCRAKKVDACAVTIWLLNDDLLKREQFSVRLPNSDELSRIQALYQAEEINFDYDFLSKERIRAVIACQLEQMNTSR